MSAEKTVLNTRNLKQIADALKSEGLRLLVEKGAGDLTSILRQLREQEIRKLDSLIKSELGDVLYFRIDLEARLPEAAHEMDELQPVRVLRGEVVIACKKEFARRYLALNKVLSSLLGGGSDWLICALAADKAKVIWHKFEEFLLYILPKTPPVKDYLYIFHAAKEMDDGFEALKTLEDILKREGALMRSWSPAEVSRKLPEAPSEAGSREKLLVGALTGLARGTVSFEEFLAFAIGLSKISLEQKTRILDEMGCHPKLETLSRIEPDVREILRAVRRAQRKFEPEFSLQEIFGIKRPSRISMFLLKLWLDALVSEALKELDSGNVSGEGFRSLLKIAVALELNRVNLKEQREKELVVRYLLSLGRRLIDAPVTLTSSLIRAVKELSDFEFSLALAAQRILEVHGALPYIALMRELFPDRKKRLLVTILQLAFSSDVSVLAMRTISHAVNRRNVLRKLNKVLSGLGVKPRGIIAGMPWETPMTDVHAVRVRVEGALRYYREAGVRPPQPLIMLERAVRSYESVMGIDKHVSLTNPKVLAEACSEVAVARDTLDRYSFEVRVTFATEQSAMVARMGKDLNSLWARLSESWEKLLIKDYSSAAESLTPVWKLPEIIREELKLNRPLLLIVIDGLRIDDYFTKLRPVLRSMGLSVVRESLGLSTIPSITNLARRSIFGGREPIRVLSTVSVMIGHQMGREDEWLIRSAGQEAVYVHGSFGTVLGVLDNLARTARRLRVLAVVLSELEKAAHGATEAYLAKITTDYAREMARVIRAAVRAVRSVEGESPRVVLVSDHGLEAFTRRTDVSFEELEREMRKHGFLDALHEPEIRERFAIVAVPSADKVEDARGFIEGFAKGQIVALKASDLGYKKAALKLKKANVYDTVPADRVLLLLARGGRVISSRYLRRGRVVFHGGLSPAEMIVPVAVLEA